MNVLLRLALLAQLAGALSAGVLLRFETTDHSGPEPRTTTSRLSVDDGKLSMETQLDDEMSQPRNSMIYEAANRTMFAVDHPRKMFFKLDEQTIGGMADTMERMLAQMQERMKDMPPQQRAAMERMLRNRMGGDLAKAHERPKPEIVSTGAGAEVNGFACDVYEVKRDGVKERELCVTDWGNIEGSSEVMEVMKDMAKFTEAITSAMRRASPIGTKGNPLADLNELPGFPVSTKEYRDGKLTSESVLKSAEKQSIDPGTFIPPRDYTRQEMRRNQ